MQRKYLTMRKKEIIPLKNKEKEFLLQQRVCDIWRKVFSTDDKKYQKVRDHCHYTGKYRKAAHDICNLRYKTPREVPVVFHNDSNKDYHLIIKDLAKEFEGNLNV